MGQRRRMLGATSRRPRMKEWINREECVTTIKIYRSLPSTHQVRLCFVVFTKTHLGCLQQETSNKLTQARVSQNSTELGHSSNSKELGKLK